MRTRSIWGTPPKRIYKLLKIIEQIQKKNKKICIVGCSDGKFLMPFARNKIFSVGYDIDEIALYGGNKDFPIKVQNVKYLYNKNFKSEKFPLETKHILGINERLKIEGLEKFADIKLLDFYRNTPKEKFDLVFTSCSLHYSKNAYCSLEEKVKKLQSIVDKDGYLYIDYMMAIDENDFDKYPSTKFFRKREILNYFGDDFKIISIKENDKISFEGAHVDCVIDHFHRFGYIFARRIK